MRADKLQEFIDRFGDGTRFRVQMRECDDVPRFIERLDRAHERTAHSTLRFGPQPFRNPKELAAYMPWPLRLPLALAWLGLLFCAALLVAGWRVVRGERDV